MSISNIPSTYRGMKRLKQISSVFMRHGFNNIISKMNIGSSENAVSDSGKARSLAQHLLNLGRCSALSQILYLVIL